MTRKKNQQWDDDEDFLPPSRSQLKRDSAALQKMGEELAALPPSVWQKFSISDDMRAALEEYAKIKSHEAKRRHLQYIGRLMRAEDAPQIERGLAELKAGHAQQTAGFHMLENLRDRILDNDDSAWQEVRELLAGLESDEREKQIKRLEACIKAVQERKDKAAFRTLFRSLKDLSGSSS